MGVFRVTHGHNYGLRVRLRQSLLIMTRSEAVYNWGFPSGTQNDKHNRRGWSQTGTRWRVDSELLQMPGHGQANDDDAGHNPVNDEHFQGIGLQVANEPGDGRIAHNR